jgi:hypothetical protein
MNTKLILKLLRYAAIFGNVIFILWITYNGIDEGFRGTPYQIISYIGLVMLLSLNSVLLFLYRNHS